MTRPANADDKKKSRCMNPTDSCSGSFSFSYFLSAFAVDFSCTVIFAPDFGEASADEFSCAGFAAACARSFNSMPARGFISLRPLKMPPSSIWKALT